jgi:hypothetical protein
MSLQNIVNAIQEIIAKDGTRMQKRLSNIELHLHQHPNVTPALLQANLPAEVARAGLQPRVYQNVLSLHR